MIMIRLLLCAVVLGDAASRAFADTDEIEQEEVGEEDLDRKITFLNTDLRSGNIEMTQREINEIFDKKKHKKNKLSRRNKKKAANCRKRGLLLSVKDRKCYKPTLKGPCKDGEWFVAVKRQLQGFCKINECTSEENPIMFNGTCSALYGSCPPSSRLYLNKRGRGFCDCEEGFSFSPADSVCHREQRQGPCAEGQTWQCRKPPKKNRRGHQAWGRCKEVECGEGEVEWRDRKCYKVDSGQIFDKCLEDRDGQLVIEDGVITCSRREGRSRSLAREVVGSCRRTTVVVQ